MEKMMRSHADAIVTASIRAVQPDEAVARALNGQEFSGRVVLIAAGKAAWQMAKAADDCLGSRIDAGIVITKYDHVMGPIADYRCFEAGHPVPDENSFPGTQAALDLVSDVMSECGIIICEHPAEEILPVNIKKFSVSKSYKYGKIMLTVYRREQLK